jgi:hypothetical protein
VRSDISVLNIKKHILIGFIGVHAVVFDEDVNHDRSVVDDTLDALAVVPGLTNT